MENKFQECVKAFKNCLVQNSIQSLDIIHFLEEIEPNYGQFISLDRAKKLKQNLKNSALNSYNYSYKFSQDCLDFIDKKFQDGSEIEFEFISIPEDDAFYSNKKVTFSVKTPDDKHYLLLDVKTPVDITEKHQSYLENFLKNDSVLFDKYFQPTEKLKYNTGIIIVKKNENFNKLVKSSLIESKSKLYVEIGIVSFDFIDFLKNEAIENLLNIGQITFFISNVNINSDFVITSGESVLDVHQIKPPKDKDKDKDKGK